MKLQTTKALRDMAAFAFLQQGSEVFSRSSAPWRKPLGAALDEHTNWSISASTHTHPHTHTHTRTHWRKSLQPKTLHRRSTDCMFWNPIRPPKRQFQRGVEIRNPEPHPIPSTAAAQTHDTSSGKPRTNDQETQCGRYAAQQGSVVTGHRSPNTSLGNATQ
jgi:hypothetical protein